MPWWDRRRADRDGEPPAPRRAEVLFPAEDVLRARAALGGDSAAVAAAEEAAALVAQRADEVAALGVPAGAVDAAALRDRPELVQVVARLADAEERHLVLTARQGDQADVQRAETLVERRRALEAAGTGQRPLLGLALVVRALVAHAHGAHEAAMDSGREAVRLLRRAALDDPDARAALVVALDSVVLPAVSARHKEEAYPLLIQATDLARALAAEDPAHRPTLEGHLLQLAAAHGEMGNADKSREVVAELTAMAGSAPRPADAAPDADALYARGVELSSLPGRAAEAQEANDAAVAAYRRLLAEGGPPDRQTGVRRKLALALWRQSMLRAVGGRATDALEPGREGVALAREVLRDLGPRHAEAAAVTAELATAMNDLSQAALAAARVQEHEDLIGEVLRLCDGHRDVRVRRAAGTALHNLAARVLAVVVNQLRAGAPVPPDVLQRAVDAAGAAVAARQRTHDRAEAVSTWELVSSLHQRGKFLLLLRQGKPAVADLSAAWRLVGGIGGANADRLRGELSQTMQVAEQAFPREVAAVPWRGRR